MDDVYRPGLNEPIRNESITVGTTSTIIAENRNEQNPRKMILVRNISDAANKVITVNLGQSAAVANKGIVLQQYESFSDSTSEGYKCIQDAITAICAVAGGSLAIVER